MKGKVSTIVIVLTLLMLPQIVFAADPEAIDSGTTAWMLAATALVLLMIPGLVAITPAAGVVKPAGALTLGALASIACYLALKAKARFGYDDTLDCFGIHGIGSGLGVVLLSFFIRKSWMQDAAAAAGAGGWTVWNQLSVQLMGMAATIALAVIGTIIIYFIVEKSIGFRIDQQMEIEGLDQSLHGEHGYGLAHPDLRI
jgi:Amt family ammonium transporter